MMEVMKKRIAIDMDEVIADTLRKFIGVCNRELGLSISKSDLTGEDALGHHRRRALPGLPRIRYCR